MKIKNESVSVKIGNKERCFKNLILDNYIELFRDSFLNFKDKTLDYCFLKFNTEQEINENSTTMEYDVVMNCNYNKIQQIYVGNAITNKYVYDNVHNSDVNTDTLENHAGDRICGIGFGKLETVYYDNNSKYREDMTIYAFLDVSKYNITVQEGQKIIISRTDKVSSDLSFFTPFNDVKLPYHLSIAGLLETIRHGIYRSLS